MKKTILLGCFTFISLVSIGQLSTLTQNFNTACATASFPSDGWSAYNPIIGTTPQGQWACTATDGRPGVSSAPTPGMTCTGVWSSAYHLDTSYLLTPLLNLSSYAGGRVYLQFDSKTDNIILGGRLTLGKTIDSTSFPDSTYHDASASLTPAISSSDSSGWVTHQIDMTPYIDSNNFYMAFRYTSTSTTGTAWFIDNVNLTTVSLVDKITRNILPLTVIGSCTSNKIELSYSVLLAGNYQVAIYDMLGRQVYAGQVLAQTGTEYHTIDGLNLRPGMYCIKMGNENTYGVTKLMID